MWELVLEQFEDLLVRILLLAACISFVSISLFVTVEDVIWSTGDWLVFCYLSLNSMIFAASPELQAIFPEYLMAEMIHKDSQDLSHPPSRFPFSPLSVYVKSDVETGLLLSRV